MRPATRYKVEVVCGSTKREPNGGAPPTCGRPRLVSVQLSPPSVLLTRRSPTGVNPPPPPCETYRVAASFGSTATETTLCDSAQAQCAPESTVLKRPDGHVRYSNLLADPA